MNHNEARQVLRDAKKVRQTVVAEWTDANGWMVMLPDGSVIFRQDARAVKREVAKFTKRAIKDGAGIVMTVIDWRNVPADQHEEASKS